MTISPQKLIKRSSIFLKNNPLLTNILGGIIVAFLLFVLNIVFANEIYNFLFIKIQESSGWLAGYVSIISFLFFIIVTTSIYIVIAFKNKVLKKEIELKNNEIKIIDDIGLFCVLENNDNVEIIENYESIRNTIKNSDKTKLDLLLSTGYEFVSMHPDHEIEELKEMYSIPEYNAREAAFHSYLKDTRTPTRILLLDPYSEIARSRGEAICPSYDHYKYLILRSIAFLQLIDNNRIEYGFYDMTPVWKIIKNRKISFVQAVHKERAAREEYWHGFINKPLGITDGFESLFEKKWQERNNMQIDKKLLNKEVEKIKKDIKYKMK